MLGMRMSVSACFMYLILNLNSLETICDLCGISGVFDKTLEMCSVLSVARIRNILSFFGSFNFRKPYIYILIGIGEDQVSNEPLFAIGLYV